MHTYLHTCILYPLKSHACIFIPRETSCINLPALNIHRHTCICMHACKLAKRVKEFRFWFRFKVCNCVHMQCGHGIPECPAYGYLSTEDVGCR